MRYNKKERGHGEERLDMPGGWMGDERTVFTASGRTKAENEVFEYTKKLFTWRKNAKAIHHGKTMHFVPVENNFYVYFRYTQDELVMVAINNCRTEQAIDWQRFMEVMEGYAVGTDIITGKVVRVGDSLSVLPQRAMIMQFRKNNF
jgi:glycosidase